MSGSLVKKSLFGVLCVAFIAALFLVDTKQGYFDSVGKLLDSRVNSGSEGSSHSLNLERMRPSFQPPQ